MFQFQSAPNLSPLSPHLTVSMVAKKYAPLLGLTCTILGSLPLAEVPTANAQGVQGNSPAAVPAVRVADSTLAPADERLILRAANRADFLAWQQSTRQKLLKVLGIPNDRVALNAEKRGESEHDGVVLEKWVFTSEPGSRLPAVLYRPKSSPGPMPAVVLTFGHGGSKSQWSYNYAGMLYAKLGVAVLAIDPIGEEERDVRGRLGTRAHDPEIVNSQADKAGRLIMGKLVFDTMRGIDFLCQRKDIDSTRLGVMGNSLGGAKASWMAALEPRLKMAIVCGWAYDDITIHSKFCTKLSNERMRRLCSWPEFAALAAPGCALLIMNGDADWVIDQNRDGSAWTGTKAVFADAARASKALGGEGKIEAWFESQGGHRPYFDYTKALEWTHQHLGTPGFTLHQIRALPTLNAGKWCDAHDVQLERLYGTQLHDRGATLVDLNLRPTPRNDLTCLRPSELGSPDFTIDGWLEVIAANHMRTRGELKSKE